MTNIKLRELTEPTNQPGKQYLLLAIKLIIGFFIMINGSATIFFTIALQPIWMFYFSISMIICAALFSMIEKGE